MATQEERRRETRRKLIATARRHFAERGYTATSTAAILEEAGVSRGAMYHHYRGKVDLFADVYETVAHESVRRAVASRRPGGSPLEALADVCLAWLREARDPEVVRIVLDQGPAVLGLERARDIEARHSLKGIEASLARAEEEGEVRLTSRSATGRLLNAMLAEAAHLSVSAPGEDEVAAIESSVREWIVALAAVRGEEQVYG
ncbi:MAG: helix-turn-helix domain-containing protein [Acidobacteriota bacterium]